jgi:hypothetical protein
MLAFVGEANEGLPDNGCVLPPRTGIRLGVVGASAGTDVVGDVLRRFEGEESIAAVLRDITFFPYPSSEVARYDLLWKA